MDHGTSPRRRGFSVLELTIAIAILGVMMAIAGIALLPNLGRAQVRATRAQMLQVGDALTQYKVDNKVFPATLRELTNQGSEYLTTYPLDGWDQEFFYSPQGPTQNTFILISYGEDGVPETDDDITYEEVVNRDR